ncbi:MAG TPA: hypothetical protein VHR88_00180 [Solirubrobacteraceae bacterium]|jgi:hypothetical protein|nr:hypothetical protein [Solirubrobacteraceae bacterium]
MAHLLLPAGYTDDDRRLAERIAVSLQSDELVVCRQPAAPRPAPRRPRPSPPSTAALALSLAWAAVTALSERFGSASR